MLDLSVSILRLNGLHCGHYAEPFAGGCGLALSLLYGGHVAEIHINDLDRSIWSFWHSVLFETDEFTARIAEADVTIDEWHRQREIHREQVGDTLTLGFAAFFLNRTNRSGIIKGGGVIGGLDQSGTYKLDCRFNAEDLVRRIRRVARYRERIHLSNLDALDFLDNCSALPSRSLLFIDPPYFKKGPGLYTSFYKAEDHSVLASKVLSSELKWVVTYDDVPQIRDIYKARRQFSFDIHYSLQEKRMGSELLIVSKGMQVPTEARNRLVNRPQSRKAA